PWLGKTFPELFAKKTRVPMGYVIYFATPIGDHRFTYPNLPTYNFPGVTGWPALPVDNRGFRVRGAERAPTPAPTAASGAPNGPNTPVSTNGPVTDTGSNLANAGRTTGGAEGGRGGRGGGGAAGRGGANAGGNAGGGRGNQQQQDVPPQQQD